MRVGVNSGVMKKTPALSTAKLGPGEYRPDIAFARLEDLPQPKIIKQRRNYESRPCPHCRKPAPRDKVFTRQLHDVGDLVSGRPREVQITYSQHYCAACRKYFNADLSDVAPRPMDITPIATWRWPCAWWRKMASPIAAPVGRSGATIVCLSRLPPSRTG